MGLLSIEDEDYLFAQMPDAHLMVLDVLDYMFHVYLEMVEAINHNLTLKNSEIAKISTQREIWIKQTIWVLQNLAACKPAVLDKYLVIEEALGNGMCWLDKIVDLCFKSIQLLENRFMFVQLMIIITNFLSTCTDEQLFLIRNE